MQHIISEKCIYKYFNCHLVEDNLKDNVLTIKQIIIHYYYILILLNKY